MTMWDLTSISKCSEFMLFSTWLKASLVTSRQIWRFQHHHGTLCQIESLLSPRNYHMDGEKIPRSTFWTWNMLRQCPIFYAYSGMITICCVETCRTSKDVRRLTSEPCFKALSSAVEGFYPGPHATNGVYIMHQKRWTHPLWEVSKTVFKGKIWMQGQSVPKVRGD